jgi:hypothetical protein
VYHWLVPNLLSVQIFPPSDPSSRQFNEHPPKSFRFEAHLC